MGRNDRNLWDDEGRHVCSICVVGEEYFNHGNLYDIRMCESFLMLFFVLPLQCVGFGRQRGMMGSKSRRAV